MEHTIKNDAANLINDDKTYFYEKIDEHMLLDGYPIIMDLKKSHDNMIYDNKSNTKYMDFFTGFSSIPISYNHPQLNNFEFIQEIGRVALTKITNSDVYTQEFLETAVAFKQFAIPDYLKYLFFIEGGALAVENALKTAFDWKIRKNLQKGLSEKKVGQQKIIHFNEAFHGRSGYTLSLTNTEHLKVQGFPKFEWPRIHNPKVFYPMDLNRDAIIKSEKKAMSQIHEVISIGADNIAGLIIEPIQCEGGENHFRKEFLTELQNICFENDILFIIDEVQTGMGVTGKVWAHQHYDIKPDIICFGKKAQVCGIIAGSRLDEVNDHVFQLSSRINSTWGGNIVDAFRLKKYIEIINDNNLIKNAEQQGSYLLSRVKELQEDYSDIISNARGLGLLVAIDMPNRKLRDKVVKLSFDNKCILLPCGEKSIRFRPMLDITSDQIDQVIIILYEVLRDVQ